MQRTLHPFTRIAVTLICAIVFRGLPRAQDLTAEELLPPIGSSFHHHAIADLFPWDTLQGSSVIWDYSWTAVDSTNDMTYLVVEPADAPAITDYPDANRVVRSVLGTNDDYIIDRFYAVEGNRMVELGSTGPVLTYVFEDPEIVYGLPMQLGDTLWDDYCYWSDGLGVQYHFCGTAYVAFDAMGTLILPYGSFTDVKHVTQWHTSIETTQPDADTTRFHRQQWFAPGLAHPILEVRMTTYADGTYFVSGSLMDGAAFTGVDESSPLSLSAFPNPTTGALTLQRETVDAASVEVLGPDGRIALTAFLGRGETQRSLALDDLPDGLYLLRLSDAHGTTVQRIAKQR